MDANTSENGLLPMMVKLMMDKDAVNAKIEYLVFPKFESKDSEKQSEHLGLFSKKKIFNMQTNKYAPPSRNQLTRRTAT
jgi:hypothetical protein